MMDVLKTEGSGDRGGLCEEVTFERRPDGVREQVKQICGRRAFWVEMQPVQRPWGRCAFACLKIMCGTHPMRGMFEGQLGSQRGWSWLELLEQGGEWAERGQSRDGEGRL